MCAVRAACRAQMDDSTGAMYVRLGRTVLGMGRDGLDIKLPSASELRG